MADSNGANALKISYVKAPSAQGDALYEELRKRIEAALDGWPIEWNLLNGQGKSLMDRQAMSFIACYESDVMIFDGSIENGDFSQYEYAFDPMRTLNHALIVSRTRLPYNFEGARKGGAPGWIEAQTMRDANDALQDAEGAFSPDCKSNEQIIHWALSLFQTSQLSLPREDKFAMPLGINALVFAPQIVEMISQIPWYSRERMDTAFVSFLSRESRFYANKGGKRDNPTIEELLTPLSGEIAASDGALLYFPPGGISTELMT